MANIFTTSGTGMPVNRELISTINSQAGTKVWAAFYTPGLWKSDDEAINYQKVLPRLDINDSEEYNINSFTKELVSQFKVVGDGNKKVPAYFTTTKEVINEETGDYKLVVNKFTFDKIKENAAKLTPEPKTKIELVPAKEEEEEVEGVNYIIVDNEPAIFENPMIKGSIFKVTYVPTLSEDSENEGTENQVQSNVDEEGPVEEIEVETVNGLVHRFGNVPYKIEVTAPEMIKTIASSIPTLDENNYKGKKEDGVEEDGVNKLEAGENAVVGITILIKNRDKITQIDPVKFAKDGYTTIITTDLSTHFEIVYNILYCERLYDGAPLSYRVDTYSEKMRIDWENK